MVHFDALFLKYASPKCQISETLNCYCNTNPGAKGHHATERLVFGAYDEIE